MCSVVFENRYGYEDPEFLRLLDLFSDNFCIMSSRQGEKDPESHFQETLVMTTHNHFLGSTETTSTTLRYGLLILLKYPEVGTFMIPLLVSAHQDLTQFKDADCFNPTNFLNDKGKQCAWVQAWPDPRSSSPPFYSSSACSLWGAPPTSTSPHSAPSLPTLSGGPLKSGSATLCSLALRPPYPLWSIKALNCRRRRLLTNRE
ncbi:uncharacterized protein [Pseudorca crassidens]|uniref:uncharacterized protein n=1 Tax=Pseudorca crassidens TaxID=82174 RepID=UPI00352F6476